MKNHYKWITTFLLVVSVFWGMTSCQPETEIKYVEVEKQPDGVAPADVTNLVVTNKDASVLLTWTDATDEDIYGYEVSWKTSTENRAAAAMESNSLIVSPGTKGCYITNLKNGTGYTFMVQTVDVTGMKSTGVTKTITPSIIVGASADVYLVRSPAERTNKEVTVKVEMNSEIAESVKKILWKSGTDLITSGSDITETKEFVTYDRGDFTVKIEYADGTFEFFFINTNNIDKEPPKNVTNVQALYSKETGKVTLSWENPTDEDFVGTEIVYGKTDSEETTTLTFDKDTTETVLENIKIDTEGTYTVKICPKDDFGNISKYGYSQKIAFTIPKITSVFIPEVGTSYAGKMVPISFYGKNLDSPLIGAVSCEGATLENITSWNSNVFSAEILCPDTVGATEITVSYGDSSVTGTLKVIESVASASSYKVGDIILTDGTKVSVDDVSTYTIDENNKPIGVVAMISDDYGFITPKVIGLQEDSYISWASSGTTGLKTKFTNIVCTPRATYEGAALTVTFTGDTDGSDNWAEICAVDPEGTQDAATNYPIFNFANTYGITAGLTGTDYETGWYVPSLAELYEVYKNKEVIQRSLFRACGFTIDTSDCYYWSSSQYEYDYYYAYQVDFSDGSVCCNYKGEEYFDNCGNCPTYKLFVLQALTAK